MKVEVRNAYTGIQCYEDNPYEGFHLPFQSHNPARTIQEPAGILMKA